jgi:hypothetical protein
MPLGDYLKAGHRLSVQDRPMGLAEDVIVYFAAACVCEAWIESLTARFLG